MHLMPIGVLQNAYWLLKYYLIAYRRSSQNAYMRFLHKKEKKLSGPYFLIKKIHIGVFVLPKRRCENAGKKTGSARQICWRFI